MLLDLRPLFDTKPAAAGGSGGAAYRYCPACRQIIVWDPLTALTCDCDAPRRRDDELVLIEVLAGAD